MAPSSRYRTPSMERDMCRRNDRLLQKREATIERLEGEVDALDEKVTKYKGRYHDAKLAYQLNLKMLSNLTEEMEELKTLEKESELQAWRSDQELIAQLSADRDRNAKTLNEKNCTIRTKDAEIVMLQRVIFNLQKSGTSKNDKEGISVDNVNPNGKESSQKTLSDVGKCALFDTPINELRESIRPHLKSHIALLLSNFIEETGLKRPEEHKRLAASKVVPKCLLDMERKLESDPDYRVNNFVEDIQEFTQGDALVWKGFSANAAAEMQSRFLGNLNKLLA